jgi:hypothetical protein
MIEIVDPKLYELLSETEVKISICQENYGNFEKSKAKDLIELECM